MFHHELWVGDSYWLCALITTLITQGLLVQPGEVSMPHEKVTRVVDGCCLVKMSGHPVIETCLGAWSL